MTRISGIVAAIALVLTGYGAAGAAAHQAINDETELRQAELSEVKTQLKTVNAQLAELRAAAVVESFRSGKVEAYIDRYDETLKSLSLPSVKVGK